MSRGLIGTFALVSALCITSTAGAHHPPLMERCYSLTFTGHVEQVEWRNPHVELLIRTDSGESHLVTWLTTQQLGRAGIDRDSFRAGDQVIVTVGTRDDVVRRPMLLAAITKVSTGWEWSQTPQGC